jgi:hypothetical protein
MVLRLSARQHSRCEPVVSSITCLHVNLRILLYFARRDGRTGTMRPRMLSLRYTGTGLVTSASAIPLHRQGAAFAGPLGYQPGYASAPDVSATTFTHRVSCILLVSATVLQKVAIPGTGSSETSIPISMAVLFGMILLALVRGVLVVDGRRLAAYLLFLASTAVSFILSDSLRISMTSWIFMVVMQATFTFRFAEGKFDFQRTLRFVSSLAVFCSMVGVAQFFSQFVIDRRIAFFMDYYTPPTMLMSGFNFTIPIIWDSPILKSNGVFFAEPSFFCQFLAVGLIVELLRAARPVRLGLIGFGIICSYSGTGLMTLALFVPWYIISRRRFDLMILGGIAVLLLLTQAQSLQLSAITDRTSEFTNPNSSGFGRFVSIFLVIHEFILRDLPTLLFGRGPGSVMEYFTRLHFGAFDPTWGKIFYEYGLIGSVLYMAFFTKSYFMSRPELRVPLCFTYFFLGGYLVNSSIIIQLLVLVSLPAQSMMQKAADKQRAAVRLRGGRFPTGALPKA